MSSNIGELFFSKYEVLYSSIPDTAMSGVAAYPASGAYLDVSEFERVHIIASFGTIHNSDTPALEPYEAEAIAGTLDQISSSLAMTPVPASDDNKSFIWTIEVADLSADHHFLALKTSGTLTNGTYVHVLFLGEPKSLPVTQTASIVKDAVAHVGGQVVTD